MVVHTMVQKLGLNLQHIIKIIIHKVIIIFLHVLIMNLLVGMKKLMELVQIGQTTLENRGNINTQQVLHFMHNGRELITISHMMEMVVHTMAQKLGLKKLHIIHNIKLGKTFLIDQDLHL